MILNKLLSILIIWSSIVTTIPFVSNDVSNIVVTMDAVKGRLAEVEEGKIEDYSTTDSVMATNVSLAIDENKADLSLIIDSQQYSFSILLLPSCLGIYAENTVIGIDSFSDELISFRIEKDAQKIGLMPNCETLEGKTVLYLGVFNDEKNVVYYFQVELRGFDIEVVIQDALEGFEDSGYTNEMMERIEVTYLTLSIAKSTMSDSGSSFSSEIEFTQQDMNLFSGETIDTLSSTISQLKEASNEGFVKTSDMSALSLINGIPDIVYKSGKLDEWKKEWNGWDEKTGYAVYPMSYGLSNSGRLHYVMTYSIPVDIDWDTQEFDIGFKITNNCWVLYMTDTEELTIFDSRARVAADANVYYKSKSDKGVFTRRYYTINKADTWFERASKFVIGYIPYVGDAVKLYETLSGSGDLTKDKWYPYADSYELQASEGKIIKEVFVYAEELKQVDDYIYLRLEGDGIHNISYGFSYNVYDPVWW